jgi:hypothetical protein
MGVPRTGLHAGTRFSVRSGRNGTEYTTLGGTVGEFFVGVVGLQN